MNTKQFIALFVLILIISGTYAYDVMASRQARRNCAKYAMPIVIRSFGDSLVETKEEFPPKRLKAESSQAAKANYDFFYNFCMDNFEYGKR